LNGNGVRENNEGGLAGVTIYVDLNWNGVPDDNEPQTRTMRDVDGTAGNEAGNYVFENLRPGFYVVREVVPTGYQQTYPVGGIIPLPEPLPMVGDVANGEIIGPDGQIFPFPYFENAHTVWVTSGEKTTGINFGNMPLKPGTVSGTKWEDVNGNGQRDDGERGIGGVTIYVDVNGNGSLDQGEPHTKSLGIDAGAPEELVGSYKLTGLRPGMNVVREVVPNGYMQTYPLGPIPLGPLPIDPATGVVGDFLPPDWYPYGEGAHYIWLGAGDDVGGVDFGNQQIKPGVISGLKWNDLNGNTQRDDGEPGIAGVVVYVDVNHNGVLDDGEPSTRTRGDNTATPQIDETGTYVLENVRPGWTIVREIIPDGYRQTFPAGLIYFDVPGSDPDVNPGIANPDGTPVGILPPYFPDAHYLLLPSGGRLDGIDFGNQQLKNSASVHGFVWSDLNSDGRRDPNEPGLGGIVIYADLNLNGRMDSDEPAVKSDEDNPVTDFYDAGFYVLDGLRGGP
ncbi:MAG: hypothetical protein KDA99_30090, partial [Planctomycetales bacterium]|nr:hypothetical protein [Planctomycetales bacterium]